MTPYGIINDLYVVDFSLDVLLPRFIDIMEENAKAIKYVTNISLYLGMFGVGNEHNRL